MSVEDFPFYVYELMEKVGGGYQPAYIGKGSGQRLATQQRKYKLDGCEVCRFMDEGEAYRFEAELIKSCCPRLNIAQGWWRPPRMSVERMCKRYGTRETSRLILLQLGIDIRRERVVE